ncbi:hypothetical protein IH992_12580 [Candidatus Poribacteria bacterium]|nr:hypothetical protein [Candidatus Poribacteria bacterium]
MNTSGHIINNTALSNLAQVDLVSLLQKLYDKRIYTALLVADEIKRGIRDGYSFLNRAERCLTTESDGGWIHVLSLQTQSEQRLYLELRQMLHPGEAECLALAISRKFVFVTDDKAARRHATRHGVPLTGTIGILVQAVKRSFLSLEQANQHLTEMIAEQYYSPVDRLDDWV